MSDTPAKMKRKAALAMTPEQRGRMLVEALRRLPRRAEPKDFVKVDGDGYFRWRYSDIERKSYCGTSGCAIGLAMALKLLPGRYPHNMDNEVIAESLGLPHEAVQRLFFSPETYGTGSFFRVTPHAVARKLEQALDEAHPPAGGPLAGGPPARVLP